MCSVGLVYPHRDRYSTNYNTVQHTTSPTGRQTLASVVVLVQNHMAQDPLYDSVINLFSHGSRSVVVIALSVSIPTVAVLECIEIGDQCLHSWKAKADYNKTPRESYLDESLETN